ncbi:MAG: glucose-fructose oxidoreductase, partial [Maribacter sp.]
MEKITRRTFTTTLGKGLVASALLSPTYSSFGSNKSSPDKLGVALVGLGSYSSYQLAPSLLETDYCYLSAIVTGTKEKEQIWKEKYGLSGDSIYNYENFDSIINNPKIDVVYVVLPNSMHADFCIRAAKAGKHVICEKPMAISVVECNA